LAGVVTSDAVRRWDAEAAAYDEPADHGLQDPAVRAAWRDLLLGALPPSPGRVADLGCGTGTLARLVAEAGYAVDGVDFSSEMVRRARAKVSGRADVTITEADASAPPLAPGEYNAVLCRHVLWALPDPVPALRRWVDLLRPGGRLVLVEGSWSTGAGLRASKTLALLSEIGRSGVVRHLTEASYWGREITDERYLVLA
jgi:SAM-dependent methyltransferase